MDASTSIADVMHTRSRVDLSGPAVSDLSVGKFDLAECSGWVAIVYVQAFRHTQQVQELAQALPKFKNRAASVVFVAQDSEFALLQWAKAIGLPLGSQLTLVSDRTRAFKTRLGIQSCGTLLLDSHGRVLHESSAIQSVDEVLRILDGFIFVSEHQHSC